MAELESEKEKGKSMKDNSDKPFTQAEKTLYMQVSTAICFNCGQHETLVYKYPYNVSCIRCGNGQLEDITVHKQRFFNRPIDNFRMASYGKP